MCINNKAKGSVKQLGNDKGEWKHTKIKQFYQLRLIE